MSHRTEFACLAVVTLACGATNATLSVLARKVEDTSSSAVVAPGSTGASVVRAQILLDRARSSPGQIDGAYGDDLRIAIEGYREAHGLSLSGTIDAETWKLLSTDKRPILTTYIITPADVKRSVPAYTEGCEGTSHHEVDGV